LAAVSRADWCHLERLHLPDEAREVLQRVPLIGREVVAFAKAQVANDHIERLHYPTQLASVACDVLDDAPLEVGIAGADVVDVDKPV
jgi:hypothetical protein